MITDKNGKELYCGDLVRYNSDSEGFCEGDSEIYIKNGWEVRTAYSYEVEKIEDENE